MLQGISDIGIAVDDIEKAMQFYETLGFRVEPQSDTEGHVFPGENSPFLYVFETKSETGVERDIDLDTNPVGVDHISIQVEDVDEVYKDLSKKGISFELEPTAEEDWGIRLSSTSDPSGNIFYFVSEI